MRIHSACAVVGIACLADGAPIYVVDFALASEAQALALMAKPGAATTASPRALMISTQFAENPALGGIVEIATKNVNVLR
jgi:hypothetical protein